MPALECAGFSFAVVKKRLEISPTQGIVKKWVKFSPSFLGDPSRE
ncbi:hypothetical protein [Pseudophaeobacter sp.]